MMRGWLVAALVLGLCAPGWALDFGVGDTIIVCRAGGRVIFVPEAADCAGEAVPGEIKEIKETGEVVVRIGDEDVVVSLIP